jgi:hypothetical protein
VQKYFANLLQIFLSIHTTNNSQDNLKPWADFQAHTTKKEGAEKFRQARHVPLLKTEPVHEFQSLAAENTARN